MKKQVRAINFLLYNGMHIQPGTKFDANIEDIPMLVDKNKIGPENLELIEVKTKEKFEMKKSGKIEIGTETTGLELSGKTKRKSKRNKYSF